MFKRGDLVKIITAKGIEHGRVVYTRNAPPDYEKPMAVCVDVVGRANSVIFPANKVLKVKESS